MNTQLAQYIVHGTASWPRLRPRARQRFAIGFLALTLAVSAGLPAVAGDPHRDGSRGHSRQAQGVSVEAKRGGKKSVKKTFSNASAIAIPLVGAVNQFGAADPYPSTINVRGFKKARIVDVNLTLRNFSHTATQDVDVLLVAPGGRNAVVMGDVGADPAGAAGAVSGITVKLDDEAASPLPAGPGKSLTTGSFQPLDSQGLIDSDNPSLLTFPAPAPTPSGEDALSTFDGVDPNGTWTLFVLDDAGDDTGAIAGGWKLEITAKSKKRK
jgi:subtilisin-like proprotein convertase family protein